MIPSTAIRSIQLAHIITEKTTRDDIKISLVSGYSVALDLSSRPCTPRGTGFTC